MSSQDLEQMGIVFIVDDDDSARFGVQELLTAHGYQTEAFCSAEAFLDRLPIETVGCLILDIQMPGVSGMELQEMLVARGFKTPIIFLTAHGDVPSSVKAIKSGAEDFLPKLAEEEELLEAIKRAIRRSIDVLSEERQHNYVKQCAANLTDREREVCEYLIAGWLNKQIARRLDISDRTVKAHKASVMQKFEVNSLAQLAMLATQAGISARKERSRNDG